MSSTERPRAAPGREARLLTLIIVVSIGVLALMAQFRFPDQDRTEPAARPPNPLERLAARATYDELASVVATLERRLEPSLLVLRLAPAAGGVRRFVPALRVGRNLALARLGTGDRPEAVVGDGGAPLLLGLDPLTRLASIRVHDSPGFTLPTLGTGLEEGRARYVAVVEGSPGGVVVRPMFLGRTQPLRDPKWSAPLAVLGGTPPAQDGAFIFSIEGELVGMAVIERGVPVLAPPTALLARAESLAHGSPPPAADIGIEVQELTPALAETSGATEGIVVAYVDPQGPAYGVLQVTDVIEAVGAVPMLGPDSLRVALSKIAAGSRVELRTARQRRKLDLSVKARALSRPESRGGTGLTQRPVPREGVLVLDVEPGSPAFLAGIRVGDLVAYLGSKPAPTPADISRAFEELPADGALFLGVRQREGHHVVTLRKP